MFGVALRFATVGAGNTLLTWVMFYALASGAGMAPAAANAVGWTCGIGLSFIGNRHWAFGAAGSRLLPQLRRFLLVALLSIALSSAIVAALAAPLGLVGAQLAATATTLAGVFILYRRFVFMRDDADED